MNRAEKEAAVAVVREKFSRTKIALLADYRGMTVAEMTELRRKFREAAVEFRVVKNNLAKIALEGTPVEPVRDGFRGPTAVALGYDDPVAPAKILNEAAKAYKHLEIRTAVMDGTVLGAEEIARIAALPSREELLGMFLRVIQAPLTNLARVLQAPLTDLVCALRAVGEKKSA